MEVRKEILRPGTTIYIDPRTGKPEKFVATPDRIKYMADQGNLMLADGLTVPVPLEHQPDARPLTSGERAAHNIRNNAGHVKSYEVGADSRLFGVLDIADPSIADKLGSTIKFTSPWINSFTDGNGKRWEGVISHVALTTRPRIVKQEPFARSVAAAMSLVGKMAGHKLTPANVEGGICLSMAGMLQEKKGKLKPLYPNAFSMYAGIKLAEDELDESPASEDFPPKKADDEGEEETPEDTEPSSPLDEVVSGDEDVSIYEMIGHLMKVCGLNPPDQIDESNALRAIYETLMARAQEIGLEATAPEEEEPAELNTEEENGDVNPIVQENPSMYASLAEISRIEDPTEKKLATELFKTRKKLQSVSLSIIEEAKTARDARLKKLLKMMPKEKAAKIAAEFAKPSAQMSLGDDGAVVDPMAVFLDGLEAMRNDITAQLSAATEQPHPADGGIMTLERQKAVVDEVIKNTGGIPGERQGQKT